MREYHHEFAQHWFYTPSFLEKSSGLSLIRAGTNIAKPNYQMGPRIIAYHSFHFVLSGDLAFNQDEILRAGDMFCLWPNLMHQYSCTSQSLPTDDGNAISSEPLRMFWIALDGRQVPVLAKMIGVSPQNLTLRHVLNGPVNHVISEICHLLQEMEQSPLPRGIDAKVLSLIYSLFYGISTQVESDSNQNDDWLTKAEEYIRLHSIDGVTVHDVVKHVGLSRSHVSRSFTAKYGLSPNDYIQETRMKKAAEMLETSTHSITEVALSLGYPDLYSFTRAFKHYFTLSPSIYRNRRRSN